MTRPARRFSWDNEVAIVRGLEAQYPRVSRINLSADDLDRMIRSLPGFVYGEGPDDDTVYSRLLLFWINMDDADDSGRWDSLA